MKSVSELLEKIGVKTNNVKLFEQAFTHTSYAYENNLKSYETLEFLGDAIVDLLVSDYLFKSNLYKEGEMTKIRASYVCENALYEYANDLGFGDYIKLGIGEKHSGGDKKKAILSDVFESFVAAMYLDKGFEKTKDYILKIVVPYIENKDILLFNDYKSALQEAVQTNKKSVEYVLLDESGPAHNRCFRVAVLVDDIVLGEGIGSSKKQAEQEAAKKALSIMSK